MKKIITNLELANETGLSKEHISRLLNGRVAPTKKTAIMISEATAKLGIKTSSVDIMFNPAKVRRMLRGE